MELLEQMLNHYSAKKELHKEDALLELLQEIVLCGLSRAGFFRDAVLIGDTALRLFHGLDRLSEELDFYVAKDKQELAFEGFLPLLRKEAEAFGLRASLEEEKKSKRSDLVFRHYLLLEEDGCRFGVPGISSVRICMRILRTSSEYAGTEHRFRLLPAPYEICKYDDSSLFAEKLYAILGRTRKAQLSGKDLYDYAFCIGRNIPVNLRHLRRLLIKSHLLGDRDPFGEEQLKKILKERFQGIDYRKAVEEVLPFLQDPRSLTVWGMPFFTEITDQLLCYDLFKNNQRAI